MAKHKCLNCEVIIDFEPVYCCSGRECGCMGLPIDPPLCGDCEKELFKNAED